jgi:hypothetical protein
MTSDESQFVSPSYGRESGPLSFFTKSYKSLRYGVRPKVIAYHLQCGFVKRSGDFLMKNLTPRGTYDKQNSWDNIWTM